MDITRGFLITNASESLVYGPSSSYLREGLPLVGLHKACLPAHLADMADLL